MRKSEIKSQDFPEQHAWVLQYKYPIKNCARKGAIGALGSAPEGCYPFFISLQEGKHLIEANLQSFDSAKWLINSAYPQFSAACSKQKQPDQVLSRIFLTSEFFITY